MLDQRMKSTCRTVLASTVTLVAGVGLLHSPPHYGKLREPKHWPHGLSWHQTPQPAILFPGGLVLLIWKWG